MFLSRQTIQFIVAIQEESLLKASEKIAITPSAMSRGISELENKIGSKLIKRTRNGIQPTDKGKSLYLELLPHYNEIQSLANRLKKSKENLAVMIGTDGLYIPKIKEKMHHFIRNNSEKKVQFLPGRDEIPEKILSEGIVDIYISTKRSGGNDGSITSISMEPELIGLVVHSDILGKYKKVSDILARYKVVQTHAALKNSLFIKVKKIINENKYSFDSFPVADINEICYLVNKGDGVSFMSNAIMNDMNFSSSVQYIEKPFTQPIILQRYICFKSERYEELMNICSLLRDC